MSFKATQAGYSTTKAVIEYNLGQGVKKHHITLDVVCEPVYRATCKSKNQIAKEAQQWLSQLAGQRLEFIN
jgi:hypothetical protein